MDKLLNFEEIIGNDNFSLDDSKVLLYDNMLYSRLADKKFEDINEFDLRLINVLLNSNGIATLKSETLGFIVEDAFMTLMEKKDLNADEKKKMNITLRYIECICEICKQYSDFPNNLFLFNHPSIINFIQIFHMKKIPDEYVEWAEYILSYKIGMKFVDDPDLSQYDEYVKNKISVPKQMKEKFLRDISIINIKTGQIPMKYVEYMIGQMLDSKSNLSRISQNQRANIFINFSRGRVKKVFQRDVFVLYTKNISKKDEASYLNGIVKMSWKNIETGGLSKVIDNLITLFHELRHVKQETDKAKGKINHKKYMMIKEDVLQELDPEYYDRNYKKVYEEIDARVSAAKETYHFLSSLPLSDDIKKTKKFMDILQRLKKVIEKERGFYVSALSKRYKNQEVHNIEEYFDGIIKKYPEKLEKYPILRIEYNEDGSRKDIVQIFGELCTVIKHKENRIDTYDIYRYILFSRLYNEKDCIEELLDVEIPEDLSESLKRILSRLRNALLQKYQEISKEKSNSVIPGKKIRVDGITSEEIASISSINEKVSSQEKSFISGIIKSNSKLKKCSYMEKE